MEINIEKQMLLWNILYELDVKEIVLPSLGDRAPFHPSVCHDSCILSKI